MLPTTHVHGIGIGGGGGGISGQHGAGGRGGRSDNRGSGRGGRREAKPAVDGLKMSTEEPVYTPLALTAKSVSRSSRQRATSEAWCGTPPRSVSIGAVAVRIERTSREASSPSVRRRRRRDVPDRRHRISLGR